ncbi:restriction endonuclease subunit S [Roseococcus sp. SYP-B2431]|uniref:restriction endonuclease subunit S n=1 Tax=Roseococcus sp. SYP-B2431 TaxID=2496640 RepID=UPI0010404289|nr:restriction endonuclease subunit S [Roseococcus sp. SYP-B2431]TCH97253.1 restriction endonuclease subunit S [Roseococcus sp. SYP-B2431]
MNTRAGALRYFARIKNGTTPASGDLSYWDGEISWATPDDLGRLDGGYISDTRRKVTDLAVSENNLNLVPAGTLIMSTRAPIGHMAIAANSLVFNQGCRALIPETETWARYLLYLLKSRVPEMNASANGTTFVELSRDDLASVRISLPALETQKRIAAFLDEKTAQIDALIAGKQALLDRLAEKRQAIITQAVTKGLNPKVAVKDSGTEWLGQIPAHWEALPLRRQADWVMTGRTPAAAAGDFFSDGEIPWFTPGDFDTLIMDRSAKSLTREAFEAGHAILYPANSILLVGIGATLGKVALAPMPCASNQQINAIVPGLNSDPLFLTYFLHAFRAEVRMSASGNTLPILNQDKTKNIIVTRPPHAEQVSIARHLEQEDNRILFVAKAIEKSLSLLSEHRAALITNAVTGQIEGLQ